MNDLELEKYWNEKHPQQRVIYSGRSVPTADHKLIPIQLDVKDLISANDSLLQQVIQDNSLKADSYDETMLRIQKWVVSNLRYVSDDINIGTSEYWQFPFETLALGVGDCEDGAILIASLAINAGVPNFRVRVTAGMVQQAPTAPMGGHGYCTYLAEDGDWRVIDWCYLEDSQVAIKDKPIFKNNIYYKEIWFSFNHLFSYGNKEYEISGRIAKRKASS